MSGAADNLRSNAKRSARLSQPWNLPRTLSDASDKDFYVLADPGGLFTDYNKFNETPPPPPPEEPPPTPPMPATDDQAAQAEKRKSAAKQKSRRGRANTVLTGDDDSLGSTQF